MFNSTTKTIFLFLRIALKRLLKRYLPLSNSQNSMLQRIATKALSVSLNMTDEGIANAEECTEQYLTFKLDERRPQRNGCSFDGVQAASCVDALENYEVMRIPTQSTMPVSQSSPTVRTQQRL